MHIPSYPSIFVLGHKAIRELLDGPVVVQEKVDGSQFSFGLMPVVIDAGVAVTVELCARSKGADIYVDAPDKMFRLGVEQVRKRERLLRPGWVYRGEYLAKPKHNALAYDRVPVDNVALFDVDQGGEMFLTPTELADEAARLGFEVVPTIYEGVVADAAAVRELLDRPSFLGGQRVEGLVIKNYARVGVDKHTMMGKFVSEKFKEVHGGEWRKANPTRADVIDAIVLKLRTPARWAKAVQHLREAGQLTGTPRDIGLLFQEVPTDIEKEEREAIVDAMWGHFWPKIARGCTVGLAEWYKEQLMEAQFEKDPAP